MSVQLTHDRILVEPAEVETTTGGGIIIANAEEKETTLTGTVIGVSEGRLTKSGKVVPLSIQAGDKVIFEKNTGDKVVLDEKQLLILTEDEILAVIDE